MAISSSEYFPRGGKKPDKKQTSTFKNKKNKNLFSIKSKVKPKKTNKKAKNKVKSSEKPKKEEVTAAVVDQLSYNNIQDGMLILGCVKTINDLALQVELPGRIYGSVPLNSISDEYTKNLENMLSDNIENSEFVKLNEIFKVGQYIPTKVISSKGDKNFNLLLSVKPSLICCDLDHRELNVGQLLWIAVSSLSDHGYQMTNGKKNCRIFLPENKIETGRKLVVGEPLWCVVEKCHLTSSVATLTVTALDKDVFNATAPENVKLHSIIPGMAFNLSINQVVKYGIEVKFNEQYTGYVHDSYYKKKFDCKLGENVIGRVLYVQPTTNLTYFTLRGLENAEEPSLNSGFIGSGKVLRISTGVLLKIKNNNKGFVSFKRALPTGKKNVDINKFVQKKYVPGSIHKYRILDYHHLDNIYICTLETSVIKEKWFSIDDVVIGEKVQAKIREINEKGILVSFGRLTGFIKNLHIGNVKYADKIKKKFNVGQKLQPKILNIEDNRSIYLTLHQGFIDSENVLNNYDEATVGTQYPGTVVKIFDTGALVTFYGNVKGFLPRNNFGGIEPKDAVYEGQVVNVFISEIDGEKLTLNFDFPEEVNESEKKKKKRKKKEKQYENKFESSLSEIDENRSETKCNDSELEDNKNNDTNVCDLNEVKDTKECDKKQKTKKKKQSPTNNEENENVMITEKNPETKSKKGKEKKLKEKSHALHEEEKLLKKKQSKDKNKTNSEVLSSADEIGSMEDDEFNDGWLSDTYISVNGENKLQFSEKPSKQTKKTKLKTKKLKDEETSEEWLNTEVENDEGIGSSAEDVSTNEIPRKKKKSKKEQAKVLEENDISTELKQDKKRKKRKSVEESDTDTEVKKIKIEKSEPILTLPGVTDFFSDTKVSSGVKSESDSDENETETSEKRKKKRLSAAERKEIAQKQEEEIRRKEMELLETSENPQSADQFDRLLIANPNSSRLWIQYMAFHIGNTQNDRARAVAKKALETIDIREFQEKLNVWLALLNLENRFGDKESFEKTFEEAVRCNDSYQVYIETIKMLADSQSYTEMQDKIRKIKGKFKHDPKMWTDVAKVYYMCGRFQDARNFKQGALRCVINKKEHVNLITQFAIMEFNHGEPERGEALLETVIQSVPQRVDVWCTYVDQLIKQNKIDLARRVLDRSICQRMSSKKIATLFKKYKSFEEMHGTPEHLERLKKLAAEYKPIE